jgi:ATP-dependent Clp protease adaptor protein ClpS
MDKYELNSDEEIKIRERHEVKAPSLYKVFLLNDDYTTMDFVTTILENIFHKTPMEATQIMLHVHKNGKGLAGIFTRGIAETKVASVAEQSKENGFPLKCSMEKE